MAVENGWPMSINWDDVKDRVFGMKIDLEDIIADTGVAIVYNSQHEENSDTREEEKSDCGPRMRCIFWKELLEELKSSGSRRVSGASGQFASFNKTQPG
jgi:hypothetical protein